MKIGTFVGKENEQFTQNEIDIFKTKLTALADKYFGKGKYNMSMKGGVTLGDKCNVDRGVHFFIKPHIFETINGKYAIQLKSKHKAHFEYLHFFITKHKGYDEAVEGIFYNWENGYKPEYNLTSFGITASLIGDWKGYRRKTCEMNVGIIGSNKLYFYDFDTDANELIADNSETEQLFANTAWELETAKKTKVIIDYYK